MNPLLLVATVAFLAGCLFSMVAAILVGGAPRAASPALDAGRLAEAEQAATADVRLHGVIDHGIPTPGHVQWYLLVRLDAYLLLAIDPLPGEPGGVGALPRSAAAVLLIPSSSYETATRKANAYLAGMNPRYSVVIEKPPGLADDDLA